MGHLIFFSIIAAALLSRGTGTFFGALALLVALLFAGIFDREPGVIAAVVLVVFSGAISGRVLSALLAHLLGNQVPRSLTSLLVVAGYLFVLENPHTYETIHSLNQSGRAVSTLHVFALAGDLIKGATVVAACALIFAALIELPFGWVFRGRSSRMIAWLPALRPLLLAFFIGLSISQAGTYFSDILREVPVKIRGAEAHG